MKKKIILAISAVVLSAIALGALCSFTSVSNATELDPVSVHTSCEGKHCSGTVGCDCPGFKPITDGDVWEQSYCKHCGHHKRCHK
ncbi:MAG: hypothetical protein ACI3ZN_08825 [Candidatus Cryptobacteroides sp.]